MNPKYSFKKVNGVHFDFLLTWYNFLLYFSGGPVSDFGPNRDLRWPRFPADELWKVNRRNLEQWHVCQWPISPQRVRSVHASLLPSSAKQIIEVGNFRPLLGVWNHWERDDKNSFESSCLAFETLETAGNVFYLHYLFK